ncbi:MAG TPA: hypothetical protein PLU35_05370 [Phycisphaerales bacterium]|nr:hypothetical protein [Phycisphaerales bacterium]
MSTRDLLFTTVYPGLITGVGLLAAWLLWQLLFRPSASTDTRHRGPLWAAPVILTLAFLVAYYGFNPKPQLWPINGAMRFHTTAVAGGAIGILTALTALLPSRFQRSGGLVRHPLTLALGAFIALALLSPLTPHALSATKVAALAGACALWLALAAAILDAVAQRQHGWRMPLVLLPVAAASIPVFLYAPYATGAQFAASLVALLCAALAVGLISPRLSLERGGVVFVLAALLSLGIIAHFYSSSPRTPPLLVLALAPLAAAVSLLPPIARRKGLVPFLAAVVPVALVGGTAALWAFLGKPDLDPYPY